MEYTSDMSNSSADEHELLPSADHVASDSVDDLPTLEKRIEDEKHDEPINPEETCVQHEEISSPTLTSPSKRRKFTKLPKFPKLSSIMKPRTPKVPGLRDDYLPKAPVIKTRITMSNGWKEMVDTTLDEISEINTKKIEETSPIWIDILCPSDSDLKFFQSKFEIHPLTTEDISHANPNTREKAELYDNYIFVITKELGHQEGSNVLQVKVICVVLFENVVLTFHSFPAASINMVVTRLKSPKRLMEPKWADWMLYALLDAITDLHISHVNGIVNEGESLDELVLIFSSDEKEDVLRRVGLARHFVTNLLSHLWAKKELVTQLTSKETKLLRPAEKIYLGDVMDEVVRLDEKLQLTRETLNYVSSTYLAKVSNEAAAVSNRMSALMKRYGAFATIFLPLMLVAGLMGMNCSVPAHDGDNLAPFFWIFGYMCLQSIVLSVIFYKNDWF